MKSPRKQVSFDLSGLKENLPEAIDSSTSIDSSLENQARFWAKDLAIVEKELEQCNMKYAELVQRREGLKGSEKKQVSVLISGVIEQIERKTEWAFRLKKCI